MKGTCSTSVLIPLLLFCILSQSPTQSQEIEKYKPRELPTELGTLIEEQPQPPTQQQPPPSDDTPLADSLKRIFIFDTIDSPDPASITLHKKRIYISSSKKILRRRKFSKWLYRWLDKPLTLSLIKQLNRDIVTWLNKNGYPLVDVIVPEQEVTQGDLKIIILLSQPGKFTVQGNKYFKERLFHKIFRIAKSKPIERAVLQQRLDWTNRNPFRRADLLFSPGEELATTDLTLQVQDRFPFRLYGGWENSGTDATGDNRWFWGFNWGNAFGLDHQLNYQFTTNNEYDLFHSHVVTYTIPLPWRHLLTFNAARGTSEVDTIAAGLFRTESETTTIGVRYIIPLPWIKSYRHDLRLGYDFRNLHTEFFFANIPVFDAWAHIHHLVLGYNASWRDRLGSNFIDAQLLYSPDNWSEQHKDIHYERLRFDADSEYTIARLLLQRDTPLPLRCELTTKAQFQWTDTNLLGPEQFAVGGYSTVRGYEESEAAGDYGMVLNAEFKLPPFSLTRIFTKNPRDQFQLHGFWDYAWVSPHNPLPFEDKNIFLQSVGVGFRYSLAPHFSLRFDYGWQLMDSGRPSRFESRAHIGVLISY